MRGRRTARGVVVVSALPLVAVLLGCDAGGGTTAPQPAAATIDFPPPSLIDDEGVTVRGTTPSGAAQVSVNGSSADSTDGFRTWSISMPLSWGTNEMVVYAAESTDQPATEVASVAVERRALMRQPKWVALDATARVAYLLGLGTSSDDLVLAPGIVRLDLDTDARSDLSGARRGGGPSFQNPEGMAFDSTTGMVLVLDYEARTLFAVDVGTGERTVLADNGRGAGPDWVGPTALAVDDSNIYVADEERHSLVSVDRATGDRIVVSEATRGEGPPITHPRGIAVDRERGRLLVTQHDAPPILAVSLATGDRTVLIEADGPWPTGLVRPRGIVIDGARERALVLDEFGEKLAAIDLVTSTPSLVSGAEERGVGPTLGYPLGLALDAARGRVLAVSNAQEALIAIDLASGDRRVLSSNARGDGPPLVGGIGSVADVAVDRDARRAAVVGFGGLLSVDLASGDRQLLGVENDAPDEALGEPIEIDLAPAGWTPSGWVPRGTSSGGHGTSNRWIVVADRLVDQDFETGRVVAVEPRSGAVSVLADSRHGAGTRFARLRSLAVDSANGRALVIDSGRFLIGVDLASGERTTLLDSTQLPFDWFTTALRPTTGALLFVAPDYVPITFQSVLGEVAPSGRGVRLLSIGDYGTFFGEVSGLAVTPDGTRAFTMARGEDQRFGVVRVELGDGRRTMLAGPGKGHGGRVSSGALDLGVAPDTAIVASGTDLLAVDLRSGDRVVVSRGLGAGADY